MTWHVNHKKQILNARELGWGSAPSRAEDLLWHAWRELQRVTTGSTWPIPPKVLILSVEFLLLGHDGKGQAFETLRQTDLSQLRGGIYAANLGTQARPALQELSYVRNPNPLRTNNISHRFGTKLLFSTCNVHKYTRPFYPPRFEAIRSTFPSPT